MGAGLAVVVDLRAAVEVGAVGHELEEREGEEHPAVLEVGQLGGRDRGPPLR